MRRPSTEVAISIKETNVARLAMPQTSNGEHVATKAEEKPA